MRIIKSRTLLIAVIFLAGSLLQGKVFSDEAEEHFRKGHRFYMDAKPEQAEVEFKKALRLNPKLSDGHYYLGSIYFKQERYSEAIKQCEQALKINPEDLKSLVILGLSLQHLGRIDKAINTYLQACAIDSQSATVHSALGLAYCAKGELRQAREEYEILKRIDPDLANDLLQEIEKDRKFDIEHY